MIFKWDALKQELNNLNPDNLEYEEKELKRIIKTILKERSGTMPIKLDLMADGKCFCLFIASLVTNGKMAGISRSQEFRSAYLHLYAKHDVPIPDYLVKKLKVVLHGRKRIIADIAKNGFNY